MNGRAKILAMLLGALVALAAGLVALTWAPDRPVEALATRSAQPPSVFVTVAAVRTFLALP